MIRSTLSLLALVSGLGFGIGFGITPAKAAGPGNAGTYLAAQHAGFTYDFANAAAYYTRALALDSTNTILMERALNAQVSLGRFDRAAPILRRMQAAELNSPLGNIVALGAWMRDQDYEAVADAYAEGFSTGGLLDGLVRPWVQAGQGQMAQALTGFDQLAQQQGLQNIAYYHKALALALAGDFDSADAILSGTAVGPVQLPRRGLVAHLQILSQLDRNDAALALIARAYGQQPPPSVEAMRQVMAQGDTLDFDVITSARGGMAEAFFSVAQALSGEANDALTLLYARTVNELRPAHVDGLLLSASLLERLEQFDLATEAYDQVPADHPLSLNAEFGRANALRASGHDDAAIEVIRQLTRSYPEMIAVHEALGDALRRQERWEEANAAYDRAVSLLQTPQAADWNLYFARAIVLERQKLWDQAEADFRQALVLSPDQPQVLNYLGYSLVERQEKLDEALAMIQTAVTARPNEGYIVDSLGWVLFRLGRYDEAVAPMERAAELMAIDPVVNDHLGDVYWAVGRKLEAAFQWRRALSFIDHGTSNEDVDPDRIRRKLDVGLDDVLAEEGADPLVRTNSGGN